MEAMNVYSLCSLALCVVGVVLLRLGWRRPEPTGRTCVAAGWASLLAAILLWSRASGWEFGSSFALLAIAVIAWLVIAFEAERRPEKGANGKAIGNDLAATSTGHKWGTFLVAGPLGACVSLSITVLATQWLPLDMAARLVWAACLYPLVWAGLMVWVCTDIRLGRAALALLLCGSIASAGLYL